MASARRKKASRSSKSNFRPCACGEGEARFGRSLDPASEFYFCTECGFKVIIAHQIGSKLNEHLNALREWNMRQCAGYVGRYARAATKT